MMDQPPAEALAVAGVKFSTILGGVIGAFISLRFLDDLSTRQKWLTFLGGWGMGATLGIPMITMLDVKPVWEMGGALLIGLFGMSLTAAAINAIKSVDWTGLITNILQRLTGGGK